MGVFLLKKLMDIVENEDDNTCATLTTAELDNIYALVEQEYERLYSEYKEDYNQRLSYRLENLSNSLRSPAPSSITLTPSN